MHGQADEEVQCGGFVRSRDQDPTFISLTARAGVFFFFFLMHVTRRDKPYKVETKG